MREGWKRTPCSSGQPDHAIGVGTPGIFIKKNEMNKS